MLLLLLAATLLRPFDYPPGRPFAPGAHRGVDLAVPAGALAPAACSGRVAFAGRTPAGRAVTIRCGPWRVTHLPLGLIAVPRGARVRRGAPLGRAAGGHPGLHIGVRRAGDPLGYVDPLTVLPGAPSRPAPPVAPAGRPVRNPTPPGPSDSGGQPERAGAAAPAQPVRWPMIVGAGLLAVAVPGVPVAVRRRRTSPASARAAGVG